MMIRRQYISFYLSLELNFGAHCSNDVKQILIEKKVTFDKAEKHSNDINPYNLAVVSKQPSHIIFNNLSA